MTDLRLDYAVPGAALSDYITVFYEFRSDSPVLKETERADRAQIRFVLHKGSGEYRFPDGQAQRAMNVHIVGPTTGPRVIHADGPVHVFGAGLTPCGWGALIGSDASTLTNRLIDAEELFGDCVIEARQALLGANNLANMVEIGSGLMEALIHDSDSATLEFVHHVDAWLGGAPSPTIETLTDMTRLSRRQLERKCKGLYGAPPKKLARKYRALRAAVALILDAETMDEVLERGFYDQSHLIREIKQFTGLTPRQIKADPGQIAALSVGLRRQLSGQIDALVTEA